MPRSFSLPLQAMVDRVARADCGDSIDVTAAISVAADVILSDAIVVRHPLGFLHAEVTDLVHLPEDCDRVRIHYFSRDYRAHASSPSTVHSHRWHLKSCVLLGRLRNNTYDFEPRRDGAMQLGSLKYQEAGLEQIQAAGTTGELRPRPAQIVRSGEVYCQPPEILHLTEVESELAVTLLLTRTMTEDASVVLARGASTGAPSGREMASRQECTAFAAMLADHG